MIKPPRLKEGSVVAVISPSWGGPHAYPKVYKNGLQVLREDLGLEVRELDYTRAPQTYLRRHPQMRAEDINDAFRDPEIDGMIASIGGDDSVRALPFLDTSLIMQNPKVLMGFSDTTTLLSYLSLRGMVTFHGPSVMGGISQMRNYPEQVAQLKELLFEARGDYRYQPAKSYNEGYPDWSLDSSIGRVQRKKRSPGWKTLQGEKKVRGRLFGGCIEVLEIMKGTRFWPPTEFWDGRILFLETSERCPSPVAVRSMLRNYGIMGVFDDLAALLIGRPRGYSPKQKSELERLFTTIVADEFGRPNLPIVTRMDFGHTDPQMILPLGIEAELDPGAPSLTLTEAAVR